MMQRKPGTWPTRYQQAQINRMARGLAALRPGRAAQLIISWEQRRAA